MFVMSFTLLVSFSYAELEANVEYSPYSSTFSSSVLGTKQKIGNYDFYQIQSIIWNYYDDGSEVYINSFNTLVEFLDSEGYELVILKSTDEDYYSYFIFKKNYYSVGFCNYNYVSLVTYSNVDISTTDTFYYSDSRSTSNKNNYTVSYLRTMASDLLCSSGFVFGTKYTYEVLYSTTELLDFKHVKNTDSFYWNGDYLYKTGSGGSSGDSSYTPTFSDDEIAGMVNTFINSEDFIAHRSSGYDDFFITYDTRAEQYYAYLYKSAYDLGMVYGTFDENGNFEPNGLSEGEGYNIFSLTNNSNFLSNLWSNIKRIFQPSQYLCFRINPVINKVHYIATCSDDTMFKTSQMIFTTSERSIVYSTKDIKLIVRDGENTLVDTDNSYKKNVLIDSSTGEEFQFELPSTPVSETPWERFLSAITSIPKSILDGLKSLFVPDLSYLNSTWEKFKEKVGFIGQAKNVVNDITSSIELNPLEPPSITIDLTKANSKYDWGTSSIVLDLSWYAPYKPAVDFIIICFSYGFFFWNLFRELPNIINGIAGAGISRNSSAMRNDYINRNVGKSK